MLSGYVEGIIILCHLYPFRSRWQVVCVNSMHSSYFIHEDGYSTWAIMFKVCVLSEGIIRIFMKRFRVAIRRGEGWSEWVDYNDCWNGTSILVPVTRAVSSHMDVKLNWWIVTTFIRMYRTIDIHSARVVTNWTTPIYLELV